MLVIVAPGQGAQKQGFLTPWIAQPGFADRLSRWSDLAGLDLVELGTAADDDTIKDTAIAQPLLVAAGLAVASELLNGIALTNVGMIAGHSVGEITAAAVAKVLDEDAAMRLVTERGKAMAAASAITPTSMAAIVGGDRDEVLERLDQYGLTPANNNGVGQIVAGGTQAQLTELAENPPTRARVIPLSVAGAFHTKHMEPAVPAVRTVADGLAAADPKVPLLSNADGQTVPRGQDYLERIVHQISHPVRWDLCMDTMAAAGVTGMLELTPAGTLTGIAKRNLKGVELLSLNTPDQVADAQAFVHHHAARAAEKEQP